MWIMWVHMDTKHDTWHHVKCPHSHFFLMWTQMLTCEQHNNIGCEVIGFFHIWMKHLMLEINMWNTIMSHVNNVKFFLITWTQNTWHVTSCEMSWFTCELRFHHVNNRIISHVNSMWQIQHVKFRFSHMNYVISLFHMDTWNLVKWSYSHVNLIFLSWVASSQIWMKMST